MTRIKNYMDEQKYKVSKDFYEGVNDTSGDSEEKSYFIPKKSMKVLIEQLGREDIVDLYVGFLRFYTQIEESEAEEKKTAEAQKAADALKAAEAQKAAEALKTTEAAEDNSGVKIEPYVPDEKESAAPTKVVEEPPNNIVPTVENA